MNTQSGFAKVGTGTIAQPPPTTTMQLLWKQLVQRVVTAAVVVPNAAGAIAVAQALAGMGLATSLAICGGSTDKFIRFDAPRNHGTNLACQLPTTLARTLLVPSLVEEVLWRVALQPPGMSWPHMVAVNAAFAANHVVASATLAERLEGRQGARAVFGDTAFLTLAFLLGNACSYVYVRSNTGP